MKKTGKKDGKVGACTVFTASTRNEQVPKVDVSGHQVPAERLQRPESVNLKLEAWPGT